MISERHFFISIGTLVVLGFLSIFFLAIRVSGQEQMLHPKATYSLTAEFTNVGQLKRNARVAIAGVKIGSVSSVSLDPQNFTAIVTVDIEQKYNKIPTDSELRIVTTGVLGDQYLTFTPGFDDEFFQDGAFLGLSQTHSALILEELIGKVLTSMQPKRSNS